jgi:predicted TPR repeat methyltransferase
MTNAVIEMQHIRFIDFKSQFKVEQMTNQKKFEVELLQRNQHHEKIMNKINETILVAKIQHEKTMMRLKIELKKTSQKKK